MGIRSQFTLSPSSESRHGSSVSDAITATNTTMTAPAAKEMNVASLVSINPASDKMTVMPAKKTALPVVLAATVMASIFSRPAALSVR